MVFGRAKLPEITVICGKRRAEPLSAPGAAFPAGDSGKGGPARVCGSWGILEPDIGRHGA